MVHKWLLHLLLDALGLSTLCNCHLVITSHMAQQCFHSEYFDSLLQACKPCRLRCSDPPAPCEHYCNPGVTSSMKGIHIVLWTFLGLTLISLALFTLTFLLRKRNSEALKDKLQSQASILLDKANTELMKSKADDIRILPRSLAYTVEECTCEDCVKSNLKVDSDHFFPLPAMEEGSTILVTTKTSNYSKSVSTALESVTGMEKPTQSKE